MAPDWNVCRAPPGSAFTIDVGSPGSHIRSSYFERIAPTTFLSTLIQTRSSGSASAERISVPLTLALPFAPRTTASSMRPETPRSILPNPDTAPMSPVYGASAVVSAPGVNCRLQSVHGFAAV